MNMPSSDSAMRMNTLKLPRAGAAPAPSTPRRIRRRSRWRRAARLARAGLLVCLLGALLGVLIGWIYLASLPSVADAEQRVIAVLHAHNAPAVAVPPPQKVGASVVAVEDQRFYSNHGIDIISSLHFVWGVITTGSTQEGGATITEQLAKILYVRNPTTLPGKIEMVGLALKMSQTYSKAQILTMYLNVVYYGHQAYGITQASETYFHTTPDKLNWGEASMLAGLPQAPSAYDPLKHFALARERQRHVLSRLVATGTLTPAQAAQAWAETASAP